MISQTATQELELRTISDWVDWMARAFDCPGFEVPREETRVLLCATAVRLVERMRPAFRHLPTVWKDRLVQAAILHQYWTRLSETRTSDATNFSPRLPAVQAKEMLRRHSTNCYV